jgi:p-cumate 2,3-dioxygenase beta subunit
MAEPRRNAVDIRAIEAFLYREAELLDAWRLDDWLEMFLPEATYEVPATDIDDPQQGSDLFIIADDMAVLGGRVTRLNSVHAYAESPHSRTRHFISNVLAEAGEDGLIAVKANFLVTRTRKGLTDTFVGRYEHQLKPDGDSFRYHRRRAILDHDALRPHGRVTIIL